jgi:hypothetical protein
VYVLAIDPTEEPNPPKLLVFVETSMNNNNISLIPDRSIIRLDCGGVIDGFEGW